MLFYKYQRPDNLAFSMLRKGEIYFASVDELNDASECRPRHIFKGSEDLWQRLADYILSHACLSSDHFQPGKPGALKPILNLSDSIGTCLKKEAGNRDLGFEMLGALFCNALERNWPRESQGINRGFVLHLVGTFIDNELPRALKEHKYIASFSRNATNATMWGHYADAERGFVIVYESMDGSFHVRSPINVLHGSRPSKGLEGWTEIGIYKDEHLKLNEVKYGKRPPKVNAFHRLIPKFHYSEMEDHYDVALNIGADAEAKKEDLVGLVKYSDWRYEKEIRAFFPAFGAILPDARVLQVGLPNLKGVIFGPRMSCENKARTALCCHLLVESHNQPSEPRRELQLFRARQTIERFDFEILPVGTLDKHYFARHLQVKPMKELNEDAAKRIRGAAASIAASGAASRGTDELGEQDAAPTGGPAMPVGNSGATKGPPSVS
jgi:hypothetical protein